MTDTPEISSHESGIIQPSKCDECQWALKDGGRCPNQHCFRFRPPDGKLIDDPPPNILINAPPVTLQPKDTAARVAEAVQAAAGTVTVDPNIVRNIGGFHRGATFEPCPEPVNDPGEPVRENPSVRRRRRARPRRRCLRAAGL